MPDYQPSDDFIENYDKVDRVGDLSVAHARINHTGIPGVGAGGGGGLPEGWTQAGDPATLQANGGVLNMGDGLGANGGAINTEGGSITTATGTIQTGGGAIETEGGDVDVLTGTIHADGGALTLDDMTEVNISVVGDVSLSMTSAGNASLLAGGTAGDVLKLGTYNAEDVIEIVDFDGAGAARIGFFSATPVAQQTLAADPTAAEISTVLRNLGFTVLP